jgi:hypothetical protein
MPYPKRSCDGCAREFQPRDRSPECPECRRSGGKKLRIIVIPDTQVKKGVPVDHLPAIGRYIAKKRPDVIVMIGDWWDLHSLSVYDRGKKAFEGRRLKADIEAGNEAMTSMTSQYRGIPGYKPREVFCVGNHEQRLERIGESKPELDGWFGYELLNLEGWEVIPFLEVVEIAGVKFSHYFTSGVMGRPVGSANVLLNKAPGAAVQGHVQKFDAAVHEKSGEIAMMVGTCYQHDEDYLGPQGNNCRRQIVVMNEVRDGIYDPMLVSLDFLLRKYSA